MDTLANLIIKILLTGFVSLSFNSAFSASSYRVHLSEKENPSNLQIKGRIYIKNKVLKGNYKVEVLYYDSVISTFNVENNQAMNLSLRKDSPYILKISKKGFVTRSICLNTSTKDLHSKNGNYSFYLETEFIETREAMSLDNEALELPVALISFDKATGNFNPNKDYTSFVRQRIYPGQSEIPQVNVKN